MNLTQMRDRVRIYTDDRGKNQWSDADLTALLNAAQQHVQRMVDERNENYFSEIETYSIAVDDDAYEVPLPSDFKRAILVERTDATAIPIPCEYVDFRHRHEALRLSDLQPAFAGRPRYYLRGDRLGIVRPATTMTIKLWYLKRLVDLANDTDTSEIPVDSHDLVCLDAAKRAFGGIGQSMPGELKELYDRQISELQFVVGARQTQEPQYVRHIPEF